MIDVLPCPFVGTGFLSRGNAYKKIKEFQLHYITQYTAKVVHNQMPKIKAKYLKRENDLKAKFEDFLRLSFPDQMKNLEYYCIAFGLYSSNMEPADFGKVPDPDLNELQQSMSDSFLNIREILNY